MNKLTVTIDDKTFDVEVTAQRGSPGEYIVTMQDESLRVYVPDYANPDAVDWMIVDNRPYELIFGPDLRSVQLEGLRHTIQVPRQGNAQRTSCQWRRAHQGADPGLIARINVEPEQQVEAGQTVLVLEAMKMENEIRASKPGIVRQIHVKPGQTVILNEALVEIE